MLELKLDVPIDIAIFQSAGLRSYIWDTWSLQLGHAWW